jgi:hypothetical protein
MSLVRLFICAAVQHHRGIYGFRVGASGVSEPCVHFTSVAEAPTVPFFASFTDHAVVFMRFVLDVLASVEDAMIRVPAPRGISATRITGELHGSRPQAHRYAKAAGGSEETGNRQAKCSSDHRTLNVRRRS